MLHIFKYDNATGNIELDRPEILLIKEFAALMDDKRNRCADDRSGKKHLRAFKEFKYIWLAIDWESFYSEFAEQDRHEAALNDSGLTKKEFDDPVFRAACRKYQEMQESKLSIKMLKSVRTAVNRFVDYFESINPNERADGKPIFKMKDMMAEVSNLHSVLDELRLLEQSVKKDMQEESTLRGGAVEGDIPEDDL